MPCWYLNKIILFLLIFIHILSQSSQFVDSLEIVTHPEDVIVDNKFCFSSKVTFSCKANAGKPVNYTWYVVVPSTEIGGGSITWKKSERTSHTSQLTLSPANSTLYIYCEVSEFEGTIRSRIAVLESAKNQRDKLTNYLTTDGQRPIILSCGTDSFDTFKMKDGNVFYYTGGKGYDYSWYYLNTNSHKLMVKKFIKGYNFVRNLTAYVDGPFFAIPNYKMLNHANHRIACHKEWTIPNLKLNRVISSDSFKKRKPIDAIFILYANPNRGSSRRRYTVNDDFKLACLKTSSENVKLSWYKPNGDKVSNDKNQRIFVETIKSFGLLLRIKNLSLDDAGNYKCVGRTDTKTDRLIVNIQPYFPVKFMSLTTPVYREVIEGSQVTLECGFQVADASKKRVIRWLVDGKEVLPQLVTSRGNKFYLNLDNIQVGHQGYYQCLVQEDDPKLNHLFDGTKPSPSNKKYYTYGMIFLPRYAIQTVARIIVKRKNLYAPIIETDRGKKDICYNPRKANAADAILTQLIVTDGDRGLDGYIQKCAVKCRPRAKVCELVNLMPDVNYLLLAGLRVKSESNRTRVTVTCTDRALKPLETTTELIVTKEPRCDYCLTPQDEKLRTLIGQHCFANSDYKKSSLETHVNILGDFTSSLDPERMTEFTQSMILAHLSELIKCFDFNKKIRSHQFIQKIGSIISSMIDIPKSLLRRGQQHSGFARRLLKAVEMTSRWISYSRPLKLTKLTLFSSSSERSVKFETITQNNTIVMTNLCENDCSKGRSNSSSLTALVAAGNTGAQAIDFSVLINGTLFEVMQPNNSTQQTLAPIIGVFERLAERLHSRVPTPIEVVFTRQLYDVAKHNPTCVSWNFQTNQWRKVGITTFPISNGDIKCVADHFSYFTLVAEKQLESFYQKYSTPYRGRTLAIFFLIFSCLTLSLTVLFYAVRLFKEIVEAKKSDTPFKLTLNNHAIFICLCVAVLGGNLTFLIGEHYRTHDSYCTAIGGLLHFFYLSTLSWSSVVGAHVLISFHHLFYNHQLAQKLLPYFFIKMFVVAWALPTLIVSFTLIHGSNNYGLDQGFCFLGKSAFYVTFLSFFFLCMVGYISAVLYLIIVVRRQGSTTSGPQGITWRLELRRFISVGIIVVCLWIFGSLYIVTGHMVLSYLFLFLHGIQGILLFIDQCLMRDEDRHELFQLLRLNKIKCLTQISESMNGLRTTARSRMTTGFRVTSAGSIEPLVKLDEHDRQQNDDPTTTASNLELQNPDLIKFNYM